MEFKGIVRMPENDPSLQGIEGLIFSFANKNKVIQVAVSRIGEVLWQNQLLVPQLPKLLSSPYESCVPVFVEKFKTLLQFTIGAFLILVLTLKGALELGQTLQLVKETSEATLWNHIFGIKVFAYTAAALGISAGIELGYMLFTDGPDEAISPVMLCVASAAFYTLSQNPNGGWILGVYSLSLLVLIYCLKKYKDWGIDKKP